MDWRSTSENTAIDPNIKAGVGLFINLAADTPYHPHIFIEARLFGTEQQVRFYMGNNPSTSQIYTGFGTGMLHLEVTLDADAETFTVHTLTDGTTTYTNVVDDIYTDYALPPATGYPYATIASVAGAGEWDYVKVEGYASYQAAGDRSGDGEVDLDDFADLALSWDPDCL
jgi:hypothetical protein